ncbi:hypothetical protein V1477_016923 [Vespula maculifrons]|uniref:Uncharacterized protein n=1 Tax=Vespula maculifrons TaxID=7453 RepID=A0ABD2B4H9_VESMC
MVSENCADDIYAFVVVIHIYESKCCFTQCKVAILHFTLLSLKNLTSIQINTNQKIVILFDTIMIITYTSI